MKFIYILFLIFLAFPYTQIIPIQSYTQPYALFLALAILFLHHKQVLNITPKKDFYFLFLFLVIGVLGFLFTSYPYNKSQEYKYLLNYISPFIFTIAALIVIRKNEKLTLKVFMYSLYAWLLVSFIQIVFNPGFLTFLIGAGKSELGSNLVNSGRGALGFAPESTHNGFHFLLLGMLISFLNGKKIIILYSIFGAVILALSSSAMLALVLGVTLYLFLNFRRVFLLSLTSAFFISLIVYGFFYEGILDYIESSDTRILKLISAFLESPVNILITDYSANARIGGLIAGWNYSINDFFLPHGMAHSVWLEAVENILFKNSWLLGLSYSGMPSGIGIIIFQVGFLGVIIFYPFFRIIKASNYWLQSILSTTMLVIFMFQFNISTPLFSIIYAAAIYRTSKIKAMRPGDI